MKGLYTAVPAALLAVSATQALAQANLPPPPPMDAYMAYQAPKAPVQERVQNAAWFLRGWYLTGRAGYSFVNVNSISNTSSVSPGNDPIPVVKTNTSEGVFTPGVAIGYQFRKSGLLSRAEIEYQARYGINYNANPFLQAQPNGLLSSSINSKIDSNLLLAKFYYDFDFGSPFIPYLQVGVGAAMNSTSANSAVTFPFIGTFQGSGDETTTNLAGDAGIGARYRLSCNFLFDLGYEFDYLGKAKWNINYGLQGDPSTTAAVTLQSKTIYSNTVLAGLTWMPIPKETNN